jgi:hypothetical protein
MCDNLKRHYAIRDALFKLFPVRPSGNVARRLLILTALISGIVGSRKVHLPAIASKVPGQTQRESKVKKFSRWLENEHVDDQTYFLPYARVMLQSLPSGPLTLIIDASDVGRGCMAAMISVVYRKRALPLCWLVVEGKKGHMSEEVHLQLLEKVIPLIPEDRQVIFLGDGEYDGIRLLAAIADQGWQYVCRTAKNILVCEQLGEEPFWYSLSELPIDPEELIELPDVGITQEAYGPVNILAFRQEANKEPFYLVTNCELPEEAREWYKKRFQIETFFSDQKSRGFHLAHSHLAEPDRLARLLIATCLAYIWLVFLGAMVQREGQIGAIHRKHRCDLSLFQIGLTWVEYCLDQELPITVTWKSPNTTLYVHET